MNGAEAAKRANGELGGCFALVAPSPDFSDSSRWGGVGQHRTTTPSSTSLGQRKWSIGQTSDGPPHRRMAGTGEASQRAPFCLSPA